MKEERINLFAHSFINPPKGLPNNGKSFIL